VIGPHWGPFCFERQFEARLQMHHLQFTPRKAQFVAQRWFDRCACGTLTNMPCQSQGRSWKCDQARDG